MKPVLDIDIETSAGCGGPMKVIACIEGPVAVKQILDHLNHKATLEQCVWSRGSIAKRRQKRLKANYVTRLPPFFQAL